MTGKVVQLVRVDDGGDGPYELIRLHDDGTMSLARIAFKGDNLVAEVYPMTEEFKGMTVQEAVDKVRKIERDLTEGRLRIPYPPEVRKQIFECGNVFMAEATTVEKARELVARINAPEPVTAELPW